MKVLYIAPVDNFTEKDGGYGNASAGILHCLNRMKSEGKIKEVKRASTTVDRRQHITSQNVYYIISLLYNSVIKLFISSTENPLNILQINS